MDPRDALTIDDEGNVYDYAGNWLGNGLDWVPAHLTDDAVKAALEELEERSENG